MNLFGKEPQEQAMQTLVHDTNSALSQLNFHISKIGEWLKANVKEKELDSELFIRVEYLKSSQKEIRDALDSYYKKFSSDFK